MPQVKIFGKNGLKVSPITHVDDWLDSPSSPSNVGENYAKFVLEYKRRPAWQLLAFEPWMKQFKLFCTYEGVRYRCTGASRRGDVLLTTNFEQEHGYERRVEVAKCSMWGEAS